MLTFFMSRSSKMHQNHRFPLRKMRLEKVPFLGSPIIDSSHMGSQVMLVRFKTIDFLQGIDPPRPSGAEGSGTILVPSGRWGAMGRGAWDFETSFQTSFKPPYIRDKGVTPKFS